MAVVAFVKKHINDSEKDQTFFFLHRRFAYVHMAKALKYCRWMN